MSFCAGCCTRRRRGRLLRLLLLLGAAAVYLFDSGAPPAAAAAAAASARRRAPVFSAASSARGAAAAPPATLVWVMLGDTHFQAYLLESIWQARIFNPRSPFILVADAEWLPHNHSWVPALDLAGVERVYYGAIADASTRAFGAAYERLWDELGRRVGAMQPTLNHRTNMAFTQMTMLRLAALERLVAVRGLTRVVHIENDQMVYGAVDALAGAADACGAALAMTRVGARMAPAVVYAASAPPLRQMLEFINAAVTAGPDVAVSVARSTYATDMSLCAAFFDAQREAGNGTAFASLPGSADGSCIAQHSGLLYDAAGLGTWVAGDFYSPKRFAEVRLGESAVKYWELPFEWRVENVSAAAAPLAGDAPGGAAGALGTASLRTPWWNGTRAFNLHVHSKQLHLWGSRDKEVHAGMLSASPDRN